MGGWIAIIITGTGAWILYYTQHIVFFWIMVAVGVIQFWSFGVMHNYAYDSAAKRRERELQIMRNTGRSQQEIERLEVSKTTLDYFDALRAPDWITRVNMVATLVSIIILLVIGIVYLFSTNN